uniref:Uncharacterized protein n=1 Tax=Naja naja TaxID=35670 RepID=A0A8C6VD35_NAJNA
MGPFGLPLFLFFFFLSTGCAQLPIALPVGPIKIPLGVGPFPSLLPNICSLPPVSGSCLALLERWYYNSELRQCLKFDYGGCGGNLNNFVTQEGCERACSPSVPVRPASCPPRSAFPDKTCTQFCSSDDSCPGAQRCCEAGCGRQCHLPAGAIRGYCPRRNPLGHHPLLCLTSCHRDVDCALTFPGRKCCRYGCHASCVPPVEEHPGSCPKMPVLQTFVPCNHTCTDDRQCPLEEKCCYDGCGLSCLPPERHSRCQLPAEPGPCQALQPRYFYSPKHGRCRVFFYGGCQGNANNFRSRSECHRVCGRSQPGKPDPIFN